VGHGGVDGGTYWGGVKEKDVVLAVGRRLESRLRARGVRVVLTRRGDTFVSLDGRVRIANRFPSAPVVSLHANASRDRSIRGVETFACSPRGRRLAEALHPRVVAVAASRDRGIKSRAFGILRKTRGPSILIELGFLSHNLERRRLTSPAHQDRLAAALAEGLVRYGRSAAPARPRTSSAR
jgi:N-acetylmuramoyl-L-alanine amidase